MEQEDKIMIAPQRPTAVMMRREMVKNPAVMGVLGPVEKAVFLASVAKTIAEYSGAELTAELAVALKWICKDVGYRATDEGDTQYLLIRTAEILKRYYAGLSLKDFRMAFEMSITGELDEFLPKGRDGQPDRNHYQQFNAEYVCKILNAYKARRGWIIKKANDAKPKEEAVAISPEERAIYRNASRQECIRAFLLFKYRGHLPKMSPIGEMLCYDILAAVGLADEIVVTLEEQRAILQRTISDYARRGYVGDVSRLEKAGPGVSELQHDSFSLARRKALIKTFAWMAKNEIQITDYIKYGNVV